MIDNETEQPFDPRKKTAQVVVKVSPEQGEEDKQYLNIWEDTNPSFKDINTQLSLAKSFSLILFTLSIVICGYIQGFGISTSITLGISFLVVFLIVFSDDIFSLRNWFSFIFLSKMTFNPFEDLLFWMEEDEPSIIYRSHRRDLFHQAIQIFKIEVIPDIVHSTLAQFLIGLSSKNIRVPYTYQVVQKPYFSNIDAKSQKKSNTSVITTIYFSVVYDQKGILSDYKIDRLKYYIKQMGDILRSNLATNFHHFKITLLSETDLVNALRTFYVKKTTSVATKKENKKLALKNITFLSIVKLGLFGIILGAVDIILSNFELLFWYILAIDGGIVVFVLLIWWRDLLFHFTKTKLYRKNNIIVLKPFKDIAFIRFRKFPRTLFLNIEDNILVGLKILNLKHIHAPRYCHLERFFEALEHDNLSFGYTLCNYPLNYSDFEKDGLKHVNEGLKKRLSYRKNNKEAKNEEWLGKRHGIWNTCLSLSVHSYKFIDTLQEEHFVDLEEILLYNKEKLRGAFHLTFNTMDLTELSSHSLISGYLFSILKDKKIRIDGSHLNYVMIQGTNLKPFTELVDVLKKGTENVIPAEFNTPLYLENSIVIGKAINTEVLEGEVNVGFTSQQLKHLLITNGTHNKRMLTIMKIVTELIENDSPSIVFDFDGNWSKLLNYFKGTRYEEEILYFKLGSAFTIDPLTSDLPYDTDNPGYLEYMFDAYGLAFKKDQRTIDIFRNTIRENPEMDLPSIQLELQTQNKWERNPISNSLLSLFSDFTSQDLMYFKKLQGPDTEKVYAYNFVTNAKTIIIDLSLLREANKKLFFSFLILSKIIHYIKGSSDYVVKNIIVPNVDIFFETYYLDRKMSYGKINIFMEPFIQKGFGMIFLANQIHYLHPNLLTYFPNLITFKATDQRDIATLQNLMNLQEYLGKGMYSQSRKNAYQIAYLKALTLNNVIVKREDIHQPFPAFIEWQQLEQTKKMSDDEIVEFMEKRGFNLKNAERRILEQAKSTIFEADLGAYINYQEEIIKFLRHLKTIDNIGNLYKRKLKEQLLEMIYPKASKKTSKKENIKKIRDDLLVLLITHGYLIESHPNQASGSETLRTSYSVGDQYERALDDYFASKNRLGTDVEIDVIEHESAATPDLAQVFDSQPRKYVVQEGRLKKAISREFGDLFSEMFEIYYAITHSNFKKALKIGHGLIQKFLIKIYKHFSNVNSIVTQNNFDKFLKYLGSVKDFPLSYYELVNFVERYKVLNYTNDTIKELSEEIYIFQNSFFNKIQSFLNGDG